jgi:hypothetical protein
MKEKVNIKYTKEEESLWQELDEKEMESMSGGQYVGSANHQSIIMAFVGGVQTYIGGVSILPHFVVD